MQREDAVCRWLRHNPPAPWVTGGGCLGMWLLPERFCCHLHPSTWSGSQPWHFNEGG